MDLRLLRAFVSVAEHGGFSSAAATLHITQPALSRRIGDLEALLGLRLFDRTSRRVQLTTAGEMLLARSHDLLAGAHALRESAQALKGGRGGILRLGSAPLTMESVLVPFLARYRKRRPDVEVQLHEQGGVRLLEAVLRGDLHLAVASAVEPRLANQPLFPWRVLAVAARSHPLARRRTVEIKLLGKGPLLTLLPEFVIRPMFDAACEAAHLRPRILMESGTPQTLVAMARAAYGIAIVPSTFRIDMRGVKAMPVLVKEEAFGRWTAINWDPRRYQPAYAKQFADALVEFAGRDYPGQQYNFAPPVARPDKSTPAGSPAME